MKKLLLIFALFSTYSSFSHELDTLITKNNFTYRFEREDSSDVLRLTNITTKDSQSKLSNPKSSFRDYQIEGLRIVKYIRNDDKMNAINRFMDIFKEITKDCGLENYNHSRGITFSIYVSSNGDIANLSISMDPNLLNSMGFDKIIDLESRVRSEYKFLPFVNSNVKVVPVIVHIKAEKLNQK